MKPSICLIGPGKVGCAITQRLQAAGHPVCAVISREHARAIEACQFIGCDAAAASTDLTQVRQADIILLAVPDDQLSILAQKLKKLSVSLQPTTLIHFSGLHPANIMRSAGSEAKLLSIHPLLAFASRQLVSDRLSGCPCALEGDEIALPLGEKIIESFSGHPFRIASDKKSLYHASACIASNFLVTLLAVATDLLSECGVKRDAAIPLLLPLIQATVDNVAELDTEQGLTGPIVRGDKSTVAAHLAALQRAPHNRQNLYRLLGEETVRLAVKSTRLSKEHSQQLTKLLAPEKVTKS